MFKVEIIGNLGGDAELKVDGGRKYVQFSVADSRRYKREGGTEAEVTNWVSCFLRDAESRILPYLKRGQRVFVRGNGELRLFSSAKDRRMKAGISISVAEIELIGIASSDAVPSQLASEDGVLVPVTKHYWVNVPEKAGQEFVMFGRKGESYVVNANGFVRVNNEADKEDESTVVTSGEEERGDDYQEE